MLTMTEERGPFYPEIVGPFQPEYRVSINEYRVPYVTVRPTDDGRVDVTIDNRFGIDGPVSVEEFNRWIGLMANAMAVAAGYSAHGENCEPTNPFKVKMMGLSVKPNLSLVPKDE
jgi:hypothetical protein